MRRPLIVSVIGCYFLLAGIYLFSIGLMMLILPGTVERLTWVPYASGFARFSPYLPLWVGLVWIITSWALLCLHNWARWVTMLMLGVGVAFAVATMLMSKIPFSWRMAFNWFEIALRAAAAMYLAQSPTVLEVFVRRKPP